MSLTATILAFTSAIAARIRPLRPQPPAPETAHSFLVKKLDEQLTALRHERDLLRNYADLMERELAAQRSMADHWLTELQQTIRERPLPPLAPYAQAQQAQQAQALQNFMAQSQNAFAQQFDGFCNCVPGRSQLFLDRTQARQDALVNQLNRT